MHYHTDRKCYQLGEVGKVLHSLVSHSAVDYVRNTITDIQPCQLVESADAADSLVAYFVMPCINN